MPKIDPAQNFDLQAFLQELQNIGRNAYGQLGEKELAHLRKIERWGKWASVMGYGTAWIFPNLLSSFLISQGNITRWLMAHHIGHRGYDRVPGVPKKYDSRHFAKGWRRYVDWMDWILPEAWNHEHNILHHYRTGEKADPDFIQNNTQWLHRARVPLWVKYAVFFSFISAWKLTYYAPNTYWHLKKSKGTLSTTRNATIGKLRKALEEDFYPGAWILLPLSKDHWEFIRKCVLPYSAYRFFLLPSLFAGLGPLAVLNVWLNSLLAEVLTNWHTFFIIGPNHSGDDLYAFEQPGQGKAEFYLRQIMGSANYDCGSDGVDYFQAWLNYQIEHHFWPDLPLLQYQKIQPQVEALCKKYGLPYVKQNIFRRFKKTLDIFVGKTQMKTLQGSALRELPEWRRQHAKRTPPSL